MIENMLRYQLCGRREEWSLFILRNDHCLTGIMHLAGMSCFPDLLCLVKTSPPCSHVRMRSPKRSILSIFLDGMLRFVCVWWCDITRDFGNYSCCFTWTDLFSDEQEKAVLSNVQTTTPIQDCPSGPLRYLKGDCQSYTFHSYLNITSMTYDFMYIRLLSRYIYGSWSGQKPSASRGDLWNMLMVRFSQRQALNEQR